MIIADMKAIKKHIVTEMFMRVRTLNTSLAFISQSYFKMSKDMRKNSTHYFIMKICEKEKFNK